MHPGMSGADRESRVAAAGPVEATGPLGLRSGQFEHGTEVVSSERVVNSKKGGFLSASRSEGSRVLVSRYIWHDFQVGALSYLSRLCRDPPVQIASKGRLMRL